MRRPVLTVAAVVLVAVACTASGCSGQDPGPSPAPEAPTAAADCRQSDQDVPVQGSLDAGVLVAKSDSTGTALLATNEGDMTMLIVPADAATTIVTAPYSNPTDLPSNIALSTVAQQDLPHLDPAWPTDFAMSQVFIVPPKWSVCALAPIGSAASIYAARDKYASAAYFMSYQLAKAATGYVTPTVLKNAATMQTCATGALSLMNQHQSADPFQVYSAAISSGTACYSSYKLLFSTEDEALAAKSTALDDLAKTPELIQDVKFFEELFHR